MNERKEVRAYLDTVQEQIRWRRARPVLALELERHLADQTEALQAEGVCEDEAVRLALEDMGDPVALGAELDRVHRPRPQWGLLGLTLGLAAVCGILRAVLMECDLYETGRLLLALALGSLAMFGMYLLDISRLARYSLRVCLCSLMLVSSLLISSMRAESYGVYPNTGRFYYVLLCLPVVYALWVYWCRDKGWAGLGLAWAGVFPLCYPGIRWYSLSNVALMLACGFFLLMYAAWQDWFGVRRWRGVGAVLLAETALAAGFFRYTSTLPGAVNRLRGALHPELDPLGSGWIGTHLRASLKDLPLLRSAAERADYAAGASFGLAVPSGQYLDRDFLLAETAARWGWLPLLLLVAAMTALLVWLAVRGLRQTHRLGRLVVLAVALSMGLRLLVSTAINLGFVLFAPSFPMLGGNTYIVVDMALIGLALSVFRGDSIAREEFTPPPRRIRRIRLVVEYR